MKIFLLAACLLIIMKVKAVDLDEVQAFKEQLEKCEEESSVGKIVDVPYSLRLDVIFCALKKIGIIDKYDYYGKEKIETACNTFMIDPLQCQRILYLCHEAISSYSPVTNSTQGNKEFVLKFLQCGLLHGAMGLVPI